jgi:hypothetical protein
MKIAVNLKFVVLVLGALMQSACLAGDGAGMAPQRVELDNTAPTRILFVGNSYLYYNDSIHNHVKRIAEENGPHKTGDYQYKSATIGGARLSHHNLDSLLEPGRLGIDEPFELVILQGGSSEPLSEDSRQAFAAKATELNEKIRKTGAEVALYMTHAYVEPHSRFDPNMIEKIEPTYVQTGNKIDALVIPVGLAFERAYKERPDTQLHTAFDGTHPSLLGSYLAACVVYASVYKRPVAAIKYDYFGAVNEDDARFLRRIADETVANFFK